MNKSRFIEVIKDPGKINGKDLAQLSELAHHYPYSQILHILCALGQRNLKQSVNGDKLALAATYTSDRVLLKSLLEGTDIPEIVQAQETLEEEVVEESDSFDWIEQDLHRDAPPETEESNIEQDAPITQKDTQHQDLTSPALKEDESADGGEDMTGPVMETPDHRDSEEGIKQPAATEAQVSPDSDPVPDSPLTEDTTIEAASSKESLEDKRELDIEETDALATPQDELEEEEAEAEGTAVDKTAREAEEEAPSKSGGARDELDLMIQQEANQSSIHAELLDNLDQLKKNREQFGGDESEEVEQIASENEYLKQQTEIIDNFIRNSPVLSKPNLSADSEAVSQKDLSKSSSTLHKDLVSEQLAQIMVKQGNRKEAVEIYKKLIRKFPQKKGYFADQIEQMRKK